LENASEKGSAQSLPDAGKTLFLHWESDAASSPGVALATPRTDPVQEPLVSSPETLAVLEPSSPAKPATMSPPRVPLGKPSSHDGERWLEYTVAPGDTLSKIFTDMRVKPALLYRIIDSDRRAEQLSSIRPGQQVRLQLGADGEFLQMVFEKDAATSLRVKAIGEGFETRILSKDVEVRTAQATGTIANSLFADAQSAGLSETKTMELAGLFGWDIDFALELRSGDRFSVVYQEEYLDGEKYREGPILAAEFVNRGKTYRAVRYEDAQGRADYYTPEGASLRKAFLRTPIRFARVSAGFNPGRMHPILKRRRAHKGVDYAAPTGTPIRAAGDGNISFRGSQRGYGKTLILEHHNGISTLYAHMSRHQYGLKEGSRVRQGQIIGYVGMSGLATGPHLHYEFRVNGEHRNPLTVKLPKARPIDPKLRGDFLASIRPLLAQLDTMGRTMLADAR
jgi:murein DD-endopeptidase MepM/ murein hydrolase activator NlpD